MKTKYLSQRSLAAVLTTILLLAALPVTAVFAATSGPNYPGSAATAGAGTAWTASTGTLTDAVGADDGNTAQAVLAAGADSQSLQLTNFGFSIPTDATVTGIMVEVNRFASSNLSIHDVTVQLLKDGAPAGSNKAITVVPWTTVATTIVIYGGSKDIWGTTWTPAQINASTFGVSLAVTNSGGAEQTASVDYVRITVTYTLATTLSVTNSPVTYSGAPQAATVTGSVPGTVSDIKYNGSSTIPTEAGTYAVTADFVPTDLNYTTLNDVLAGDFVIEKAPQATLTVNDPGPVTYGSTATLTATGGSGTGAVTFSAGASTGCSVTGDTLSVTNASGTCTVTVTKAEDDNYLVATSVPLTVTLQKAETVTTVTGGTFTYDGQPHPATVTVTGPAGLELTPSPSYSGSCSAAPVTVPEGTSCTASYTFTGDDNYLGSSDSDTITINKADATIDVDSYHVTYDGDPHTSTGTATGVNGEDLSSGLDLSGTTHTEAGIYPDDPWTFTSPNENYNNAAGTVSNSIAKATAVIIVTPYEVVYDGAPHTATGIAIGVDGEDLSAGLDLSGTTHTEAGTYPDDPWTFTSPNGNYEDSSGTVSDIITPAELTISGLTANDKPYDGTTTATLSGTPVLVGVVSGDTVTLEGTPVATFADPEIGEDKPVTVTGFTLGGEDAGNYTLTQPTGLTASITPAQLTVTGITASDKVYDGTTEATLNVGSTVLVGVAPGDTVTLDTSAAVGTFADPNVGTDKTVTISGLTLAGEDAAKYTLVQPTTTADITPAPLTVTAEGKTKTAGEPDPPFTFTYSGFVNGETSAVIDTPPTCGVSVPHTVAGTYPIVCSGGADNNYTFNYVNGTLTVNPGTEPTQTFDDVDTTYWAYSFIERLSAAGITGGCSANPPQYCPEDSVTRAQMAVFLLRGIHGAAYTPPDVGSSTGFGDVPTTYWAAAWIKQLAAEGITSGCGGGNYCPEAPVTRAEMAVFLLRSKHGASYTPPAVGSDTGFTDVPTTYWAAAWIKQLVAEGITSGCGTNTYCPEAPVTRAQMAVFLVRTFNLP